MGKLCNGFVRTTPEDNAGLLYRAGDKREAAHLIY